MPRITTVGELRRELRHQGFDTVMGGKGHWKVYRGRRLITTLPNTPSDIRSVRNCISELGKAGFKRPATHQKSRGRIQE